MGFSLNSERIANSVDSVETARYGLRRLVTCTLGTGHRYWFWSAGLKGLMPRLIVGYSTILRQAKHIRIVDSQLAFYRVSSSGRHRPVSYPDGPMTARYRFT